MVKRTSDGNTVDQTKELSRFNLDSSSHFEDNHFIKLH